MPFDKSQFIEGFKAEMKEHLQTLSLGIIKLEKKPTNKKLLESLMRAAHTIKGSSTMMGYKRIADVAHRMEDGFEKALKEGLKLKKKHFDLLLKCLDTIEPLLHDKVTWEGKGITFHYVDDLCSEVDQVFLGEKKVSKQKKIPEKKEEKGKQEERSKDVLEEVDLESSGKPNVIEGSIRVNVNKLDNLMNLSGELLISKIRLNELINQMMIKADVSRNQDSFEVNQEFAKDLEHISNRISSLTSGMEDEVLAVRMVPISVLFNTFPRSMRDLAQKKGKQIDFQMSGEETQLDKAIVDELKDPIMHLLRNAIDHGLESSDIRKRNNKPEAGTVTLSAYSQEHQVVIEVSDDGGGIDVERIKQTAIEKGIVNKERMTDLIRDQILQLIFTPGFSTKSQVSETSGRGVGLDVVREKIAKLKGMVEVESEENKGTRFIMKLPLTLAITESLLVQAGSDIFALPIDSVVETLRINPDEIKTVETKDVITVRGHILPLVRLHDIFGLPRKGIVEKSFVPVVIVQSVEKRIGILIDQLHGRQEIMRKNIGEPLNRVKNISGATILGSGKVVLMLDVPSIISSSEGVIIRRAETITRSISKEKKKRNILLAEDVFSTAMLQKNILESVGYSVVIARDGQEALDRAKQEKFDMVITDVLMPRMDGFELTEKLKKDNLYQDVPIIIVTTRGSDADKRRGLEAGADAYILKSDFTSDILLDTIERLIG